MYQSTKLQLLHQSYMWHLYIAIRSWNKAWAIQQVNKLIYTSLSLPKIPSLWINCELWRKLLEWPHIIELTHKIKMEQVGNWKLSNIYNLRVRLLTHFLTMFFAKSMFWRQIFLQIMFFFFFFYILTNTKFGFCIFKMCFLPS